MIYKIIIIAIVWFICGVVGYKICLADLQSFGASEPIADKFRALAFSLCGPIGLLVILLDKITAKFDD